MPSSMVNKKQQEFEEHKLLSQQRSAIVARLESMEEDLTQSEIEIQDSQKMLSSKKPSKQDKLFFLGKQIQNVELNIASMRGVAISIEDFNDRYVQFKKQFHRKLEVKSITGEKHKLDQLDEKASKMLSNLQQLEAKHKEPLLIIKTLDSLISSLKKIINSCLSYLRKILPETKLEREKKIFNGTERGSKRVFFSGDNSKKHYKKPLFDTGESISVTPLPIRGIEFYQVGGRKPRDWR